MEKESFEAIENSFWQSSENTLHELMGFICICTAPVGSKAWAGDHHLLKAIRQLTGPYLPIAVSCDPHGNLTRDYVESIPDPAWLPPISAYRQVSYLSKSIANVVRVHSEPAVNPRSLPQASIDSGGEQVSIGG